MNKITFSRHAKRRLQLYGINEEDIVNLMGNGNCSISCGK